MLRSIVFDVKYLERALNVEAITDSELSAFERTQPILHLQGARRPRNRPPLYPTCPPHLRKAYLAAESALDLNPPKDSWDMVEKRGFRAEESYEYSRAYRCQRHSLPRKIDGVHWRVARAVRRQDPLWMMVMRDGTRVRFTRNEFGEKTPLVPWWSRPGALPCEGMVLGEGERGKEGWGEEVEEEGKEEDSSDESSENESEKTEEVKCKTHRTDEQRFTFWMTFRRALGVTCIRRRR